MNIPWWLVGGVVGFILGVIVTVFVLIKFAQFADSISPIEDGIIEGEPIHYVHNASSN